MFISLTINERINPMGLFLCIVISTTAQNKRTNKLNTKHKQNQKTFQHLFSSSAISKLLISLLCYLFLATYILRTELIGLNQTKCVRRSATLLCKHNLRDNVQILSDKTTKEG